MSTLKVRSVLLLLVLSIGLIMVLPIQVSPQGSIVEVKLRTINLNREPLYNVTVDAYNATVSPETFVTSGQTDEDGWTTLSLINNTYYAFAATWEIDVGKMVHVGDLPRRLITSNIAIDNFNCSLAGLKLTVTDETSTTLPFTDLSMTYGYVTTTNETISGKTSFVTDQKGTTVLSNMLVNANYTIDVQRYDFLFNKTVIHGLKPLLLGGWANVTIKAPTCALLVNVVDSVNMPIPQARVEADDLNRMSRGGSGTTNNLGTLTINLTFGKYAISVYYDDPELKLPVLLNETVIDLVKNRSFVIHCEIFDIQPSVKLFDYLGQPIPNVTVEIERKFDAEWVKIDPSIKTDSNGMAPLPNVGGDYRVSVYMSGGVCETRTVSIDKTEQVVFKLNEFTLIGGYPLATSQLATIISLSLLILSFVSIVLYKRFLQKAVGEEPIS